MAILDVISASFASSPQIRIVFSRSRYLFFEKSCELDMPVQPIYATFAAALRIRRPFEHKVSALNTAGGLAVLLSSKIIGNSRD